MNKTDLIVLKDLEKASNGLQHYTFHIRYKMKPSELVKSILVLKKRNFIIDDDSKVKITKEGKKYMKSLQEEL